MQSTKEQLIDIATHQMRAKGVDGFSYSDLSRAIGIQKASIHYHYPAKSDLIAASMAHYAKQVLDDLATISEQGPQPVDALKSFVSYYRAALNEGETLCLCVALGLSPDKLSDVASTEVAQYRADVLNWLRGLFRGARQNVPDHFAKPRVEAHALLALVEGGQISARLSGDMRMFDAALRQFHDRLPQT